jgi:hypothetical protein
MNTRTKLVAVFAFVIICTFALIPRTKHRAGPEADLGKLKQASHAANMESVPRAVQIPLIEPAPLPPEKSPTPQSVPNAPLVQAPVRNTAEVLVPVQPAGAPGAPDPVPEDGLARIALSFVGADPVAEAYWMDAINDPSLSADERQNLIEDLNEDGLSDPKHPATEDLPLILSRLELLEEIAPFAMDQVNADAFLEAYKDLLNLADLATGRGEPVR